MNTSPQGIAMIKYFEGCILHAYQDTRGIWTIGYGHTGPEVKPGYSITLQEAERLLATRLAAEFEPEVNRAVALLQSCGGEQTTQSEYDALVSLCYNIGPRAFKTSTVAREHALGHFDAAANAFLMWQHPPELLGRRQKEVLCYLKGIYPQGGHP